MCVQNQSHHDLSHPALDGSEMKGRWQAWVRAFWCSGGPPVWEPREAPLSGSRGRPVRQWAAHTTLLDAPRCQTI